MRVAPIIVSALVLAGCGGSSAGTSRTASTTTPPVARGPLVVYERDYGGEARGLATLRVEPDGNGTLRGGPTAEACANGTAVIALSGVQLDRLRGRLATARGITPRKVLQPASGAASYRIATGGVELHYAGDGAVPTAAQPIVDELDMIVAANCVRR